MNDEFKASMKDPAGLTASFGREIPLRATFGGAQIIHQDSIASNTTEGWNSQRDLISKKNVLYVYTDYQQTEDEEGNVKNIPGVKIGDGKAYLIDLPFTDALMVQHMSDMSIHVTAEEKAFWNSKVRAYTAGADGENLVLTMF